MAGWGAGLREAAGAPALAMAATFVAFGAAAAEAGLGLGWALAASGLVYGMAGQLVLVQMAGAGALPASIAATAANARFLPMSIALAPLLGPSRGRRWLALPFIAVTCWAAGMRRLPMLPEAARLPWFLGFSAMSWGIGMAGTWAGHVAAPALPIEWRAALLFTNPLYFALLLAADATRPGVGPAMLAGVAAAPLAFWIGGAWGLPVAGLVGGTLAFLWLRRR